MNIENLRGFVMVAETLNFRAAAERLYISQPALSRQIAELERELGTALLNRTTRSVCLTRQGNECLDCAISIIGSWDDMHLRASKAPASDEGSLKIGMYASRTTYYLAPTIERFKAEHQGITLSMVSDTADNLREALLGGELDILCMMAPGLVDIDGLERLVLSEEYPSVMLPMTHHLADRDVIRPKELDGERFIMHSRKKSNHMYEALRNIFTGAGVEPNIVGTDDNDAMLVMRIVMGEALGLYPSDWRVSVPTLYRDAPAGTVLVHLDCDNSPFARVASWKQENNNPAVSSFIAMLKEDLGQL